MTATTTNETSTTSLLKQQWWALVTAIQFLTRIPISSRETEPQSLRDCPRYFPLVGGMIGIIAVGLIWATSQIWPVWLAVLLALTFELRVTGAMHEDAVADCCDAFGGGWTKERVLEIMKDSRLGTYGVLGLVTAFAIRVGTTLQVLSSIGTENLLKWGVVLISSGVLGRGVILLVMWLVPPIEQRESLSRDVGTQMQFKDVAIGGIWTIPVFLAWWYVLPWQAMTGLVGLMFLVIWFRGLVLRKLGGITGDCLGCVGYLGQLAVLLASIAEWPI